jgi:mannose-1-phosphate guanylyltransferase
MSRWAVILAGGSGTRFWPLSSPARPKQFLPLTGTQPLLGEALARLEGLIAPDHLIIVTGRALAEATRRLVAPYGNVRVLAEPRAASTAPALAWATADAAARDPDAAVLSLHADWWVGDAPAFRAAADRALAVAAERDVLVTVGIVPTRPDVGYGYIERGAEVAPGVWAVDRFTEKPDAERASALVARGALWNSGMFAWTARRFFAETAQHAPELAPHLDRLHAGDVEGFFGAVTPVAVDVSHFERSRRVVVLPGAFAWDDVGTWSALARVRGGDAAANVAVGPVTLRGCARTVAWSDGEPVVVDGVEGLVVVRANGRVLVTTHARAAHLKELLDEIPPAVREIADADAHA